MLTKEDYKELYLNSNQYLEELNNLISLLKDLKRENVDNNELMNICNTILKRESSINGIFQSILHLRDELSKEIELKDLDQEIKHMILSALDKYDYETADKDILRKDFEDILKFSTEKYEDLNMVNLTFKAIIIYARWYYESDILGYLTDIYFEIIQTKDK